MKNVNLLKFKSHGNEINGFLTAYEANTGVPFEIKRVYTVTGGEENNKRGFHAHKELEQIFIALQGTLIVECEDFDGNTETYALNGAENALYCGPEVWHTLIYRDNAILMVLASDSFQESDYVRNYDDFKQMKK